MNEITFDGRKVTPSKIVCLGRNYVEHIEELGNAVPEDMVFFFKPNSAISSRLLSSHGGEPLHYELEICFLLEEGDFKAVGLGIDLTKRGLQKKLKSAGLPWERCKAFDGSAVFSAFVPFAGDFEELRLELKIDDRVAQSGGVEQMINPPPSILTEAKSFVGFEDGDILMTGTPQGVGVVEEGSVFQARLWQRGKELVAASWRAS